MTITILATGGTFDKEYVPKKGKLSFKKTHLAEMIKTSRCSTEIRIHRVMMKDSLYMTDRDRKEIAAKCCSVRNKRIVITHGTDTMVKTAKEIDKLVRSSKTNLKIQGKTIVLTGALVPYKTEDSDAMFNLGCAISFVQILPPGVYIVMNGHYFHSNNVKKNKKKGKFQFIEKPKVKIK